MSDMRNAPPSAMPRIVTVLVNWRGADDTLECLESLFQSDYPHHRCVVVDNGSRDDSLNKFRAWASGGLSSPRKGQVGKDLLSSDCAKPVDARFCALTESTSANVWAGDARLVVVDAGKNHGFAGGVNIGIRCAMVDADVAYVWVLNNDTIVASNCLSRMCVRMMADPSIGMIGSRLLFYWQPGVTQAIGGANFSPWLGRSKLIGAGLPADAQVDTRSIERRMDHLSGASMLVSRKFIDQVGLMEEGYFLYFEEADWAERGKGRFQFGCADDAVVYHKEGASIGSSRVRAERSALSAYFMVRSRIRFTRRFHPWALPTVLGYSLAQASRERISGQVEQARAMFAALRGVPAGKAIGWVPE